MANKARIVTRFTAQGEMEITALLPAGVSITDVTEQVDAHLASGDLVVAEIDGLTNGQLTALKNRAEVIYLTDKADTDADLKDNKPSKAEKQAIVDKLTSRFGVDSAKVRKWLDANDGNLTRKTIEAAIRRLCTDGKDKKTEKIK